jgi:hypothetical protein
MDSISPRRLIFAVLATAIPALAAAQTGFPMGTWILDKMGSRAMAAQSQILEIIKDDGKALSFTLRQVGVDGSTTLIQWNGVYGAPPRPVQGSALTFGVAHGSDGSILITGQQPDGDKFEEVCRIAPNKRHFQCDGTKSIRDGTRSTYTEVFDLRQ